MNGAGELEQPNSRSDQLLSDRTLVNNRVLPSYKTGDFSDAE